MNTLVEFALDAISVVYPPAAPFVAIARKIEPYVEQYLPLVRAAISEGPAAYEAAKSAAPEFFTTLSQLASSLKVLQGGSGLVNEAELAVLAAHVVGVDPPGWTHEETQRWWDRAQGSTG